MYEKSMNFNNSIILKANLYHLHEYANSCQIFEIIKATTLKLRIETSCITGFISWHTKLNTNIKLSARWIVCNAQFKHNMNSMMRITLILELINEGIFLRLLSRLTMINCFVLDVYKYVECYRNNFEMNEFTVQKIPKIIEMYIKRKYIHNCI